MAAEVWVQDRGGGPLRLRGTVVIEDLSAVLTSIAAGSGANGPLNPVTQYILTEAANHLADRLLEATITGRERADSVPRILSSALGHQPFIETTLGMSQHQMLRRWPLATDWYSDVVRYVMRPARFDAVYAAASANMDAWTQGTFGDFMRSFGENIFERRENPRVFRVVEALQALWPEYPPVKQATSVNRQQVEELWVPLYERAMECYELRLRPEVDIHEVAWAFNALQSRENLERLADPEMPYHVEPDGTRWSLSASAALMLVAGAVTDHDGHMLSPVELRDRRPRA